MELTRRTFGGVLLGGLLAACGSDSGGLGLTGDVDSATPISDRPPLQLPMRDVESGDPLLAGRVIARIADQLFATTRGETNHTISPMSIAIALAMLEPGTSGPAVDELHSLLGIDADGAHEFHQAVGALELSLEDGRDGLTFRLANSAHLQTGFPFEDAYLQTVGTNYGAALVESDFVSDPEGERIAINEWVDQETEGLIPELLPPRSLTVDTRLVLVNALYLLASWETDFLPEATTTLDFTREDGSVVDVQMLRGGADVSWRGDGFVVGEKRYEGDLVAQFVLPDEGRFDEIASDLRVATSSRPRQAPDGGSLFLPKFATRSAVELIPALQQSGLEAVFVPGGLERTAAEAGLHVTGVFHQTYVSFDERGTEAAASTAIVESAMEGPAEPPVDVILDRPFLYRIVDSRSTATIFVGQVLDPTAG